MPGLAPSPDARPEPSCPPSPPALTLGRAPTPDARPRPGAEQVTTKRFGERFRGKLGFDGLFSDNIPRFSDNVRPQLVFDLGKVQYALSALVQATDPCIEALAVSGAAG